MPPKPRQSPPTKTPTTTKNSHSKWIKVRGQATLSLSFLNSLLKNVPASHSSPSSSPSPSAYPEKKMKKEKEMQTSEA
jgi:hypothetical protein